MAFGSARIGRCERLNHGKIKLDLKKRKDEVFMEIITNEIYEPVTLGNYDVRIQEISEEAGELGIDNMAGPLEDGQVYLIMKLAFKNNSETPYNMTSYLTMSVDDEEGNRMKQIMLLDEGRTINSEILPGEEKVGEIAYAVPEHGKLTFTFNPEFIGDDQWTVKVRD